MCLKSVNKTFEPNNRMRVGYKAFKRLVGGDGSIIRYSNMYFETNRVILMGSAYTVYSDAIRKEIATDGQHYMPFFHIFSSLKGAKRWFFEIPSGIREERKYVICRVIAWDIRVAGTSASMWSIPVYGTRTHSIPTFVARSYRLMEELPWNR